MPGPNPDDLARLARLSANEKECLRRRLLPQTAKEMALDLGVSHFAVEKRLKMARTKLGVSTSLAAARLLAAAEGYQSLVPRSPDLASSSPAPVVPSPGERRPAFPHRYRLPVMGVSIMLLAILGTGLFLAQPATRAEPLRRPATEAELAALAASRRTTPAETLRWLDEAFVTLDRDGSGLVDRDEAFRVVDRSDGNHDDKVSPEEWRSVNLPIFLRDGVPADWRPGGQP